MKYLIWTYLGRFYISFVFEEKIIQFKLCSILSKLKHKPCSFSKWSMKVCDRHLHHHFKPNPFRGTELQSEDSAEFRTSEDVSVFSVFLTFDQNKHGVCERRNEAILNPTAPHRLYPSMHWASWRSLLCFFFFFLISSSSVFNLNERINFCPPRIGVSQGAVCSANNANMTRECFSPLVSTSAIWARIYSFVEF